MLRRALRQLSLVRRASSFRLLFLAALGSGAGTWLAIVALNVEILDRTHSGPWLGALNAAAILPSAFIGLLGGPLVDRLSRKRLMIGSDLLRLAVFAALPFTTSPGAIVALALAAGIGDAFFRPAVLAGVPNLVAEDELADANFLLTAAQWLTTAAGPLVGGLLVAVSGPDLAYWVNAVSFLVSALLIARIEAHLVQSDRPLSRGHWRDLGDGISLVRSSAPLLVVFVVWNLAMLANGGVNVSEVVLAKETLGGGAFGFGLLWAATGVGLVFGGSVFAGTAARRPIANVYPAGIALFAAGIGGAALAPDIWVAAAALVVSGVGNGIAVVANITLVQRGAPDHLRGRAFTVIMSANFVVLGAAMFAAGPLTDRFGARWLWGGSALVLLAAAVLARALCRALLVEAPPQAVAQAAPASH
ncbi:MAG TPA: MFS transporter [Gaiellaceae bacterium]|nr:MFS transporter [Gaiellaceae bacterium]